MYQTVRIEGMYYDKGKPFEIIPLQSHSIPLDIKEPLAVYEHLAYECRIIDPHLDARISVLFPHTDTCQVHDTRNQPH